MMRKRYLVWFILGAAAFAAPPVVNADESVRAPVVSGRFYPADAEKLEKAVQYYLKDAVAPAGPKPIAVMAPHAGYVFSGQILADALNQAAGYEYDVIVLFGVNHTAPRITGAAVYPGAGFKTPLGISAVDTELGRALVEAAEDAVFNADVHKREHSIEVQLPFIQTLFPEVPVLPIVVNLPMKTASSRFAGALFSLLKNRRPLIVASTDLTHYPPYEAAVRIDKSVLSAVAALDLPKLTKTIEAHMNEGVPHLSTCMCGLSPVMTTMALVKDFGVSCGRIISYANSGDAAFSGRDRVVGYGAVSFAPGGSCEPASKPEKTQSRAGAETTDTPVYTKAEKRALISLARKSIRQFLESETAPLPRGFEGPLAQKRGAFVTLKKRGRLRGCIGHMVADTPLGRVVCGMALQAAFNDRRFPPLSLREFDDILIEISVLTPFQKVDGVEDIVLGRDGILLKKNGRSAVYLPQVATEQGWSLSETLSHLSRKAGLSAGAWKSGAHFYTFRAIVFDERDLG